MTYTKEDLDKFAQVSQETFRAYADVEAGELLNIEQAQCYKLRNLDYKATHWLPVPLACLAMATGVRWYNEFGLEALSHISRLFRSGEMLVAREGSPCIYIKVGNTYSQVEDGIINPPELESLREMVCADEASIDNGVLRLWFD